jgi:hypothetical protein
MKENKHKHQKQHQHKEQEPNKQHQPMNNPGEKSHNFPQNWPKKKEQ